MEEMLTYQGKVAIAFMVFFIAFKVLFDSWKNFGFNRLYLLGSMIISFIVPLITFTIVREVAPTFVYFESSGNEIFIPPTTVQKEEINILQIILTLYFAGVAFFLVRLLAGHVKAISIIFKSRKMQENGIPLYIYPAEIHPFAFFSKVVVPETVLQGKAFHMILNHEMVHIQEKHWLDNLTSELLCAVQWFNPFAWMMKGALKRNLEFQADNKVVAFHDAETYQMALVSMANTQGPGTFLTAINSSDLKTRIKMMKMKTENKYTFVKQLVVLPLLAVLIMGLSNKVVKTEILPVNKTEIINGKIIKGKVTDEKGVLIEGASIEVKGRQYGVITDIKGNYQIEIEPTDETLIYGYLYHDKKEVNIDGKSEIDAQLKTDGNPTTEGAFLHSSFRMRTKDGELRKPVYFVDGKELVDINRINHENIVQIDVLNDESGYKLYGEKGGNGVVLITTKNSEKQSRTQ
jgi:beta-lactamase regulating signal transducer with metallopeptidase domain